eukprot:9959902-Lingulodinium_polyedra.AAC.1
MASPEGGTIACPGGGSPRRRAASAMHETMATWGTKEPSSWQNTGVFGGTQPNRAHEVAPRQRDVRGAASAAAPALNPDPRL